MQNINLERLRTDANQAETLINLLPDFSWKRSQNGYRAKQHGGHSIYSKNGVHRFKAHNGDYKGGDVLAVAAEVGGVALSIDAKSERAATWYESFGAVRLDDAPLTLLLPLKTIATALQGP